MRKEFTKPEVEVIELGTGIYTDDPVVVSGLRMPKSQKLLPTQITDFTGAQELGLLFFDYTEAEGFGSLEKTDGEDGFTFIIK